MTIKLSALIAIIFSCFCNAEAQKKIIRDHDSRFIVGKGDYLPHIILTADHDTINNDTFAGQVTVIFFGTSWCPFSKAHLIKTEKKLWQKYKNDIRVNLMCFCVDAEADEELFRQFVAENNLTFPIFYDTKEQIYRKFVTPNGSVTRTVVADKNEKIVYLNDEYDNRNFRRTLRLIKKLVKK